MTKRRISGSMKRNTWEIQNLQRVCALCHHKLEEEEDATRHIKVHRAEGKTAMCQSCYQIVERGDESAHLERLHKRSAFQIKVEVNSSAIEFRVESSNFWAINPESTAILSHFNKQISKNWHRLKTGRALAVFRISGRKLRFRCAICAESEAKSIDFNETIGMRAFALSHWEQCHREEVLESLQGFFDAEWRQLSCEAFDFDVHALMRTARQRLKSKQRSYRTFYTVNLHKLGENGARLNAEMKRRSGMEGDTRFCLVCCSLVQNDAQKIQAHFRKYGHNILMATSPSTIFTERTEDESGKDISLKTPVTKDGNETFQFPPDFFRYSKVFKDAKRDEFGWKCILCPRSAYTFPTWHILRMFALRHIDEHHKHLFTEEFLDSEWRAVRQETRASFDLRGFSPLQYTVRGEDTFNKTDPNDYVLPQQAFFLFKESLLDTVICGFCYRSFHHNQFIQHIVLHGFAEPQNTKSCHLKLPNRNDARVVALMGDYSEELIDAEPDRILSVEGKRLRDKTAADYRVVCTPAKSEDGHTPRSSRQSAQDARKILSDTFRILQEQARNKREHRGSSSPSSLSSSSSDDENSEDEKLEESFMSKNEFQRRALKRRRIENQLFDELKPSEIREWIMEEAMKRGIRWEEPESSDEEESAEQPAKRKNKKWDEMRPQEIREMIKKAAQEGRVKIEQPSSESSSDDEDD